MKTTKILIVEDEAIIAMELEDRLISMGYEVMGVAMDSKSAIQKVNQRPPNIILMDIHIKGPLDGIDTAAKIRQQFSIPIIYLTAHADQATMQRAVLTNPFGYLLKPIRIKDLKTTIEMALYKLEYEK